ncbi:MAG: carotenoid 1,2-hydratase [Betaproteobacteria bacterium]|nr:carotenoid 1,2-hydratase [Betaproteobacteria bacterium]MDH5220518.1 carotenoid 1,2-hydratase [Betaproteobacteria bacterium]MDH5351382.1 carotenoid 1,2-hydratase [Betaproteobacteria bacterium]
MRRRAFLLGMLAAPLARAASVDYPAVTRGRRLRFPRDHGAHPEYRTEWWYATGWLERDGAPLGFQVTFFRARPEWRSANPSRFVPRQILLAHAAIADPRHGRLRHDQRAARDALGLAGAATATTDAWIDDWRLRLEGRVYRAQIAAREFDLQLALEARGAPVLQGEGGFSRKGPRPGQASYYYSRPHLAASGTLDGAPVRGKAWLDHEWSSQYLAPQASGWDWCGLNLDDGGALMAFRIRDKAGGTFYAPPGVAFAPLRTWRSPRTGVTYPVAMRVSAAGAHYELEPLMDDQELDARASTGNLYWEGAVRAKRAGREVGRGYLELTGYGEPLRL